MKEKQIKIITTDYSQNQFWEESYLPVKTVGSMNVVNLYPDIKRQEVSGFGGAFTEASGYNYSILPEAVKKELIQAYFSEEGLNYNMGRTHLNSCDFGLGNYAAMTDENDRKLETFSLERDGKYTFGLMKDAMKETGEELVLFLTPWSPPAFMKTNGEMNHGGELKPEFYEFWADYIAKYIKEMRKEGFPIKYLSVQNETQAVQTWESCIFSSQQEMEFVRDYLGPVLEKEGLNDVKLFIWDHNKEIAYERAKEILEDKKAAPYIGGVAVHWYTGDHFEALSLIREVYPDKEIFFTEGCVEYSRFMDSNEVTKAEMYAHDILGNFNYGIGAFIDWNLLLDSKGGPNHVGNYCAAPIMCTESGDGIEKRLSYYYIGHFSKYVKRGAHCVPTTRYCSEIEACGFINPDGSKVLVLLNRQEKEIPVTVREYGQGVDLTVKPHTILTLLLD